MRILIDVMFMTGTAILKEQNTHQVHIKKNGMSPIWKIIETLFCHVADSKIERQRDKCTCSTA